jgi:hypothetical protein
MTRRRIPSLCSVLAVVFGSLAQLQAEVRSWTNSAGKEIKAELVDVEGEKAVLNMNGQNFPVPIVSLSVEDQAFIKEWKKSAPTDSASDSKIQANWDGPWPKLISADVSQEIEVLKEDEESGEYIYASDHYEFICDVKLNTSVVKRFSLLFEATNQYVRELPLGMVKPFREERHKIHLFESRAGYESAGGPPNSAGVYISRGGEGDILVPLTSLGVKKVGSNFSVDYDKENTTLSHEIAHQITDKEYYALGSRGWFTEGVSEYVAQSGYRSGKFNVNDLQKLKDYVTAYGEDGKGGRALGEEFEAPNLEDFMTQDYGRFLENSMFNYGFAALVVYYYFHMDQEKDAANIKNFLKGLKEGKKIPEMYEPLLAGRSWDEMEADITKAWRSRGVRIRFK